MNTTKHVFTPGIMISQTWPTSREQEGQTLAAIETTLKEGFFEAFQTVEIPYPEERKQIAQLLQKHGFPLTYCLARVLNENKLNLSDLDETNRKRSYEHVVRCLDEAREAGAASVSFISGPGPADPDQREEALNKLTDSLKHICLEARKTPAVKTVLEPLDFSAHKKGTLGTTQEAITICRELKQEGMDLWLCIDTAHAILNYEDPVKAVYLAEPYVAEFHYCNCVTDKEHPLYGDYHIPFGPPGFLDIARMAQIMRQLVEMKFLTPQTKPPIFCEVLKREQDDSVQVMRSSIEALQQAMSEL